MTQVKLSERKMLVAVDLVVLTVADDALAVLAVERGGEPFGLALPGGLVEVGETLEKAAERELWEETGVAVSAAHLEQLATYGKPDRDPRGERVVSVAYLALVGQLPAPTAGSDAAKATVMPVEPFLRRRRPARLEFDHNVILRDGVERARSKLEYTTLATNLLPEPFTIGELYAVYEAVWGLQPDRKNFHRKVIASEGFVVDTQKRTTRGGGRPARLYRAGEATALWPPIVRGQR